MHRCVFITYQKASKRKSPTGEVGDASSISGHFERAVAEDSALAHITSELETIEDVVKDVLDCLPDFKTRERGAVVLGCDVDFDCSFTLAGKHYREETTL